MSKNPNKLTRGQRFNKRVLLPAAVVSTAAFGISSLANGASSPDKHATAVSTKLVLNPGVVLHSSPNMDNSLPNGNSANVVEQVPKGESIAVDGLIYKQLGNAAWYGFNLLSNNNQQVWFNATEIVPEQNADQVNTDYIQVVPNTSVSDADQLSNPGSIPANAEGTASWNDKTGQYELNSHPIAIGTQLPSADAESFLQTQH